MPSTNFLFDKRRSSRKRFRMGHRHDDNTSGNGAASDTRYLRNPYPDWDSGLNERLAIKIESQNPLRESLESEDDDTFESGSLLSSRPADDSPRRLSNPAFKVNSNSSEEFEFAILPNGRFDAVFEARIKDELRSILKDHCRSEQIDCNDKSVYTGLPGISLLYHQLSVKQMLDSRTSDELAARAAQHVNQYLVSIQLPHMHNSKCLSFLCGDLGVYTLCTIARNQQRLHREMLTRTLSYPGPHTALSQSAPSNPSALSSQAEHNSHYQHHPLLNNHHSTAVEQISNEPETSIMIEKIVELVKMQEQSGTPDELLYGRTGGLYAMLLVKQQLPKQTIIKDEHISQQIALILKSGKSMESFGRPLFYSWHGKEYVGAAHGYAGILYMLLEAHRYLSAEQLQLVRDSINFIEGISYPSGNYPSSIGSQTDRLVHWCHGAPGVVHLLIKAYQVYRDEAYLRSALACGDVIWARGLIKKGFGLCHGIAGNAYAFLHLYQLTRDSRHLYRAGKFAQFYLENRDKISWRADSPASLFEGYAGLAYFLADLLNPHEAKFPAFQLTTSSPVR